MFSRSLARRRGIVPRCPLAPSVLATILAALVLLPASGAEARLHFTVGESSERSYEEQLLGSSHAEGDIWGGEQLDPPTEPPVREEDDVAIATTASSPWSSPAKRAAAPWTRWWTSFVGFWLALVR